MPMPRRPDRICTWCGVAFHPKAPDRVTYCSRACAYAKRRYDHLDIVASDIAKVVAQHRDRRPCARCSQVFTPSRSAPHQRWCSPRCAAAGHYYARRDLILARLRAAHQPAPPRIKVDPVTGETFAAIGSRKYAPSNAPVMARLMRNTQKHRRRARLRGAACEPFSASDVFRRDGYRCQMCGRKTRPDYNAQHPLRPSIDHILAISAGGSHTMANCQCLCRGCNAAKGAAAAPTQLRLFHGLTTTQGGM